MLRESEIAMNESWNEIGKVLEEEMRTVEDVRDSLIRTEKGKVKNSIENCVMILNRDPVLKGAIRRNDLSIKTDIVRSLPWRDEPGSITDVDLFQIQRYIENTYEVTSEKNVNKAINIVASEQRYHPIKQYLEGLQWDGTPRIGSLLPKFLGADESAYTREIMQLLMIAAIHRIYHPGCKFEIMVCLVGGQGAGKSTFFRFLAIQDEWFTDDLKRIEDESAFSKMQGHWIIEMPEMLATVNAKSIEDIKSFISRQKETYRIPYQTFAEDRPRQCVFVGTSNNLDFLPLDRTGNRRFAPILVHMERVEKHILEDEEESRKYIQQAWAEAMVIYQGAVPKLRLSKETEEYLKQMQKQFMPEDTKVGVIQAWLDECGEDYVCSEMIYREALGNELGNPKQWEIREINSILICSARKISPCTATFTFRISCFLYHCIVWNYYISPRFR